MATIPEAISIAIQHQQGGRLEIAESIYRQILEIDPKQVDAIHLLGVIKIARGEWDVAVDYLQQAIALHSTEASFHGNLGTAYWYQRRFNDAILSYRRALGLNPDYVDAYNNLGNVYKDLGNLDEAMTCYRRALELKPDYADARTNLGSIYSLKPGFLDEAVACYREALKYQPDNSAAYNNLGNALSNQGKIDEALECYRAAYAKDPENAVALSNVMCALQYRTGITLQELMDAHAEFDRQFGHRFPVVPWISHVDQYLDRPLRIGFVSPDFGRHPVGYFSIRAFENFDNQAVESYCYLDRHHFDQMTERFRKAATVCRHVGGLSDSELAECIRADQLDILVDLAGHTSNNRMLTFARKPAPIQMTWLGHEGTTGLRTIDYLIADQYTVPVQFEKFYTERVLRLTKGYICYDPPESAPDISELPALSTGLIRFASFNNLAKINAKVIATWADILRCVPNSRLVLKYRGLGEASMREYLTSQFAAQGIDASRLELLPPSSYAEYLATYHQVDIALDPFPFGGGITTCDALWMGLPVVTVCEATFASRHSMSHIMCAGMEETVARDLDDYIRIAVELANDLPRLSQLRRTMRERIARGSLCDGQAFARDLEDLFRRAWRANQKP